jgi:polyhydroxybutyrate depolymerase
MMRLLLGLLLSLAFATGAGACARDTPCLVGERAYYIAAPEAQTEPMPAIVYLHGWGGSGAGALRNSGMVDAFLDRGYAVIAPDGVPRDGQKGRTWRFHPRSGGQMDELRFLQAVRADATEQFDLDPERILLTGFSIGGSMTAYAACLAPQSFSAYAPLGGHFWRPHPVACAGPARVLHTHGWTDGTVPLEGRVVNGLPIDDPSAFAQGDIFHALDIWRQTNRCRHLKADRYDIGAGFWRRAWDRCAEGSALEFALHPGGHSIPRGWADLVMTWFEKPL